MRRIRQRLAEQAFGRCGISEPKSIVTPVESMATVSSTRQDLLVGPSFSWVLVQIGLSEAIRPGVHRGDADYAAMT